MDDDSAAAAPPVPPVRRAWGDEWQGEWMRAHVQMAPYGRRPSMHLIDGIVILHPAERGWLRELYDVIASTTLMPGGRGGGNDETCWDRSVTRTDTLRSVLLRVSLGRDGRTIVTAFPTTEAR